MSTPLPSTASIRSVQIDADGTLRSLTVDVDLVRRLPTLVLVGVHAHAAREVADLVRSAIVASGYDFPRARIVVTVNPIDLRKRSPVSLALPIAAGILAASGQIPSIPPDVALVGGLSLSGEIRPTRGMVLAALAARDARADGGTWSIIGPVNNWAEATGPGYRGAYTLWEAMDLLGGTATPRPIPPIPPASGHRFDFSDVCIGAPLGGQVSNAVIAALTDAAPTRRPVLLTSPGEVTTHMAALRAGSLLPDPSEATRWAILATQDNAGLVGVVQGLSPEPLPDRPYRAPHHTISPNGLLGWHREGVAHGGTVGEMDLAAHGVLFLDDVTEFARETLRTLAAGLSRMPADSRPWIIASAHPCPCGCLGGSRPCACSPESRARHAARLDTACQILGIQTEDRIHCQPSGGAL